MAKNKTMKCQKNNCKNTATIMNMEYHPNVWMCTFHANREKKMGRILKKLKKINQWKKQQILEC